MKQNNFWEFLQTPDGRFSHKRLIAMLSFFILVIMVILKAWDKAIDDTLIVTFTVLCGGQSGLSLMENRQQATGNG